MAPTKEKIKGIRYELAFEIPPADFESRLGAMLEKFAAKHREHGFRAGRVPLDVIRSKYENQFIGEAINDAVGEMLSTYFKEHDINPAASPNVSVDSFVRGGALKFSAEFDILPKLDAIDFSKITVEKLVAKASDKDVGEAIKNIADSRHSSEEVKEDRKARKGDIAVIDFEGFVDGKPFNGGKGADYPLELGSGAFIPGFEDQLVGRKKDEHVEVNVTFPKDYGHAALAGKKALFKVDIKSLREKIVPAIDDAFAKELKRENLDDLKKYVRELLEKNYADTAAGIMKDRLLDELAKSRVDVPQSLVEREVEYLFNEHARHHDHGALGEKEIKKEKDELRKQAESRVRLGLIIADAGRRENVFVSDDDIQQAVLAEAMRYNGQAERVFEYYSKNQDAREALRASLFEDKAVALMLSKVRVKEKHVDSKELAKKK
jgi:trigger factor